MYSWKKCIMNVAFRKDNLLLVFSQKSTDQLQNVNLSFLEIEQSL